jgi:ubiquinone/menaquinone biosynthesis C-methylase UbiE
MVSSDTLAPKKGYKGLGMEGSIARWYAWMTGRKIDDYRATALWLAEQLAPGASVLEVAPGPGYVAIELARLGPYRVFGLDISESFVKMAAENAEKAAAAVSFNHGDAGAMPFDSESFDLIFCQAAFKNFAAPVGALNEMCRVLKPGGKALIRDLRSDASARAIRAEVDSMRLGPINSLLVNLTFKHMLLKRAYSCEQLRAMVSQTPFSTCDIEPESIGMMVSLSR